MQDNRIGPRTFEDGMDDDALAGFGDLDLLGHAVHLDDAAADAIRRPDNRHATELKQITPKLTRVFGEPDTRMSHREIGRAHV